MIKPITFCIASANNEREYTKLLLKSLKDHTQVGVHEILIFIDSDNQNTYEALQEVQKDMPMIRICKNPNDWPIGSQRNVSVMFNQASNDIVCYLQSDMVVGKDFDRHLCENLTDENTVLSCARIEPPLHPGSPEKIVKDFGIVPEEFDYDKFNEFVDELQAENRPNMIGHFAPFAIYKSTWYDKLGGFDTQFRCSREDSDMIIRMELWGLNMIQSWNACVYHFTCVSSRGKDWFKQDEEANYKNVLQQNADMQELKRFIRKWGFFGHNPRPVYDVAFNIELDRYVDFNLLKAVEPYCTRMYLSDCSVAKQLADQLEFDAHYYSNLRWNYTNDHWNKVKHLFNPTDFGKRITSPSQATGDTILNIKYSDLVEHWSEASVFLENIHQVICDNEIGTYQSSFCTIHIIRKDNLAYKHARNENIDRLLSGQTFKLT
jgi:GT2 family glycosyltransferase